MSKELLEKIDAVLNKDQQLLNEETVIGFNPNNKISMSIDEYISAYVKDLADFIMKELKLEEKELQINTTKYLRPHMRYESYMISTEAIKIDGNSGPIYLTVGVSTNYFKIRGLVTTPVGEVIVDSQTPNAALKRIKSAIRGI